MPMFCQECGAEIQEESKFCPACGAAQGTEKPRNHGKGLRCPACGSFDIDMQVQQENVGAATVTKTKSKYKRKGHGFFWWVLFGWWWWMIDLMIWICFFPIRLLIQIFKRKKYVGNSTSVTSTKSKVVYKTICLCKSCGHHWER